MAIELGGSKYRAGVLPPDGHVHSQWSWDAPGGDMEATAARAVELGLPSVAFTDHVDWTPWNAHGTRVDDGDRASVVDDVVVVEPLDVDGYLACLRRCRERYPALRILSGVEVSEPHRHPAALTALLAGGDFDRVLGSIHALPDRSGQPGWVEPAVAYTQRPPVDVVRDYLLEAAALAASDAPFAVLAHLDYPLRHREHWRAPVFDWGTVAEETHAVLDALAASGRALEVNTRMPLALTLLSWWHDAGGDAVSFGSDAHEPGRLAHDFADAAELVEAAGFRAGTARADLWGRA